MGSLILSPGSSCMKFCCALEKSISQSCVNSGSSMVGLMATSSKRAYTIPMSATPRALVPAADHCRLIPPQEMLKHSSVSVSVGSLGREDPLEEEMAIHSSILAWRIPWTDVPGRLQSIRLSTQANTRAVSVFCRASDSHRCSWHQSRLPMSS